MAELTNILQYQFMQNAIIVCLLASILCGVIGVVVVVKRMVIIAGGVAHGAYGGLGLAVLLGISPQIGILGFALLLSIIMAAITADDIGRADTVIGVLWASGMALGIIFIDIAKGYTADLMSYLFGSLLVVSKADMVTTAFFAFLSVILFLRFRSQIVAFIYDKDFARIRGVNVTAIHYIMTVVISLSTVVLIQVAGLILVIALLTIPAHIAERYSRSLGGMMIISGALCAVFSFAGLALAWKYNITAGAGIVLTAAAVYGIVQLISGRITL
ncbi:MAG: metal ABC transporter permease [Synergistaceae bacterium]|nr:metal ABC transporter permease [Synergistaceae bacterium]